MKLFLTSSNLGGKVKNDFISFVGKDPKGMTCAFITTAADLEGEKDWIKDVRDALTDLGIETFDMDLKQENEQTLTEKLSKVDFVYMNGGNTFYLLDWIRKSGFDKAIRPLLEKGLIYIGTSAGSYVAGPTIEQAHWKNHDKDIVGLKDLSALNLVPFLTFAHYTDDWKEALEEGKKKSQYEVIVLRDGEAVQVVGETYKKIGK